VLGSRRPPFPACGAGHSQFPGDGFGHDFRKRRSLLRAKVAPFGSLLSKRKWLRVPEVCTELPVPGATASGSAPKCDQSPRPARGLRGGGKGRAAPPPPWFPPLEPLFRGAPSSKRNPQGGTPIRHARLISASLSLGAVVVLGEDRATHGPRVAPTGSRPLQIPPLRPSHPSPLEGTPFVRRGGGLWPR
jgi:hypothetical protein